MSLEEMKIVEYNEIIGQLYTEKILLEEEIQNIQSEKVDMYEGQLDEVRRENRELRKRISDLSAPNPEGRSDKDEIIVLRKKLEDALEKKDNYRNERYELKRQIKVLNNKINRLARE